MSEDPMDSDDLGRKGERFFEEIASSAKFIVNKSRDKDAAGWDYVINDRLDLKARTGIDGRAAPLTCVVQVKTKWEDNTSFEMKLSAAEQLAKDPKPAVIFCVFVNRATEEVSEAYMIHLLGEPLGRTLQALRKASLDDKKNLNRQYIYYNPKQEGMQLKLDKGDFRRILSEICGPDPGLYAAIKNEQRSTLGFKENHLTFKTTIKTSQDNLISFFLGQLPEIVATIENIVETRFDIPIAIQNVPEAGLLSFKPKPVGQADVVLRGQSHFAARLSGNLFVPPSVLNFMSRQPFRISCPFFEVTAKDKKFNIMQIDIDEDTDRFSIAEWIGLARALIVLHTGGGTAEIRYNGKRAAIGNMPLARNERGLSVWKSRLSLLNDLKFVLEHVGENDLLRSTYNEIFRQSDQIAFLSGSLLKGTPGGTICYELASDVDIPVGATSASTISSYIKFDDRLLYWSADLTMRLERRDERSISCTSQNIAVQEVKFIHLDEYEKIASAAKSRKAGAINMSKGGFGVKDQIAQNVRIDFIADVENNKVITSS